MIGYQLLCKSLRYIWSSARICHPDQMHSRSWFFRASDILQLPLILLAKVLWKLRFLACSNGFLGRKRGKCCCFLLLERFWYLLAVNLFQLVEKWDNSNFSPSCSETCSCIWPGQQGQDLNLYKAMYDCLLCLFVCIPSINLRYKRNKIIDLSRF